MKIGNLNIDGLVALAPMAGVTDRAYREICKEFGVSYVISEMVSAKGLIYNNQNTLELTFLSDEERPAGIQIFGNEPDVMAKACEIVSKYKPDTIDINMGCPVLKVVGNGCGSALMKDPELCYKIIKSMKNSTDIPITSKIRKGWAQDNVNAVDVAKACEAGGVDAITIHGRTRGQMYSGKADWDIIKSLKQSLNVPIIGNGDIYSANDAKNMFDLTGCDMIMIGRGSLGNPWIFSEINNRVLHNKEIERPSIEELIQVMLKHIKLICKYKGEKRGIKEARKYVAWYMKGLRGAAKYRNESSKLISYNEVVELGNLIIKENI